MNELLWTLTHPTTTSFLLNAINPRGFALNKMMSWKPHCHRLRQWSNYNSKQFPNSLENLVVEARKDAGLETAVIEKPKPPGFRALEGYPTSFDATALDDDVNFCIYSSNCVSATVCLISLADLQENTVTEEITLDPLANKTGDIWHVFVKGDFKDMLYGYRFDGKY